MKRRGLAVLVALLLVVAMAGCREWDSPQAAAQPVAEIAALPDCDALVKTSDGVSNREIQAYQKCRFDRLEQLLGQTPSSTPSASPSSSTSASPSTSQTSTSSPTATASPTATVTPSSSPTATQTGGTALLNLPRVPWEGGPAYWKKYGLADQQGMDDPAFFPISEFYNLADNADQAAYDADHGLNLYIQGNSTKAPQYAAQAGIKVMHPGTTRVGTSIDDEVDARYELQAGLDWIKSQAAKAPTDGVNLVGWTSGIVSYDRSLDFSRAYINNADLALNALDQYFYSVPQCSWGDNLLRWRTPSEKVNSRGVPGTTINTGNCRTASSYGKVVDLQREIDNDDATLKPIWGTIEVAGIGGSQGDWNIPTGQQIQAAAFNSILHEARGIIWFGQSPENGSNNDCASAGVFRDARLGWGSCPAVAANVQAVKDFDAWAKQMAPVLNTQSLVWNFGDVDTMLKVHGDSAYIFAAPLDGKPGSKTFTLPAGINGTSVEVVGENRTLPVTGGKFVDTFASESSYHTYRVRVQP